MNLSGKIKRFKSMIEAQERRIRRYSTDEIVIRCSDRMRWGTGDISKQTRYPTHELYYIIKRAIYNDSKHGHAMPQELSSLQFESLFRSQFDLTTSSPIVELAKEHGDSALLMLSWILNPQLPFQLSGSRFSIGRSILLFKELPCKGKYEAMYKSATGISLDNHYYGTMIAIASAQKGLVIPEDITGLTTKDIGKPKNWSKYLSVVSGDYPTVENWINDNDYKTELYWLYCKPFLIRYPIVHLNSGQYVAPWVGLLLHYLCYGPYYILRDFFGNEFTDSFGFVFQDYVGRLLEAMRLSNSHEYLAEDSFMQKQRAKKPDFATYSLDDDLLLCIEVKATEEKPFLDDGKRISDSGSVIGKAVQQCHDLWERVLSNLEPNFKSIFNTCIPVIVTISQYDFFNTDYYRDNAVRPLKANRSPETWNHCVDRYQTMSIEVFEAYVRCSLETGTHIGRLIIDKINASREEDPRKYIHDQLVNRNIEARDIPGVTEYTDRFYNELLESLEI